MRRMVLVVGLALIGGGCADSPTSPANERPGQVVDLAGGQQLASWVAGAMAGAQIRTLVLTAMRESPLSEHAVSLNELIAGPEGERFVAAVARAGGVSETEVGSLVASLPSLDFYMPAEQDRLRWDGGAGLLVAAMPDRQVPRVAFSPSGERKALDLSAATTEAPLFLLQFSEHKAYRLEPQPTTMSNRIQEAGEPQFAAAYIRRAIDGTESIAQVRDVEQMIQMAKYCPPDIPGCPPEDGGGGGTGGDPSPPQPGAGRLYLTGLETFGECDNGNCFESNEFEFHAHSTIGFDVLRLEGVGPSVSWNNISYQIAPYSPSSAVTILVSAWETDGWPNPDDHFWFVLNGGYGDPVLQVTPTNNNGLTWPLRKDVNSNHVNLTARYWWSQ